MKKEKVRVIKDVIFMLYKYKNYNIIRVAIAVALVMIVT